MRRPKPEGYSLGGRLNRCRKTLTAFTSNGDPESCCRFTYAYEKPLNGEGRFIHTYMGDGNPLPSFEGEPKRVEIDGTIDEFTGMVWNSLNQDNKVSLFVRFIDIATGTYETRIVNKNK